MHGQYQDKLNGPYSIHPSKFDLLGKGGFFSPLELTSLYLEKVLVIQSCLTLSDPTNCSHPGFSVCGILQARILERITIPFSTGSSRPRDWTQVSCIAGRFFTIWAIRQFLGSAVLVIVSQKSSISLFLLRFD